jgi:hypothetical protein
MNKQAYQRLLKLGWNKDWLDNIHNNFHPKRKGKYEIKIYDIEDLDQDPETGIYIDTTSFDNDIDLSVIHHYFEGMAYVMRDKATYKIFGMGIIDGAPFEECDEHEGQPWGTWQWHRDDELRSLKLIPLPKVTDLKIGTSTTKRYIVTATIENHPVRVIYDFKPRTAKAQEDLIEKYLKEVKQ